MNKTIQATPVIAGKACGEVVVSQMGLSFWGGVNPHTGKVVDVHHDLCGICITGKILLIPGARGSCSGSAILLEMLRQQTQPAAIITLDAEEILAVGSLIGRELYGRSIPLLTLSREAYDSIEAGSHLCLEENGCLKEQSPA